MNRRKASAPPPPRRPPFMDIPSAATLYRLLRLTPEGLAVQSRTTAALPPQARQQGAQAVERITKAATPEALADLASMATGVAQITWDERVRQLGPEAVPVLLGRLNKATTRFPGSTAANAQEQLVAALRWQGAPGAQALLEAFENLDDYGRGLASMALGLMQAGQAADTIWSFFEQVVDMGSNDFVGALWGLIDLHDGRVPGALVDRLGKKSLFHEVFGFLALAGDAACMPDMVNMLEHVPVWAAEDAMMAVAAVVQRVGVDAVLETVGPTVSNPAELATITRNLQLLHGMPRDRVENLFALFFKGAEAVERLAGTGP